MPIRNVLSHFERTPRVAVHLMASILIFGVAPAAFAQRAPYFIDNLDWPRYGVSPESPRRINNSGQVIITSCRQTDDCRAFRFTEGVNWEDLGTFEGRPSVRAFAINDSGYVVGYAFNAASRTLAAFRYDEQAMRNLGIAPDCDPTQDVEAHGINNSGAVVGLCHADPLDPDSDRAFLYTDVGGMRSLGVLFPSPSGIFAFDINDSGQIVGPYYWGPLPSRQRGVYIYHNGAVEDLGKPEGSLSHASTEDFRINNAGQVMITFQFQESPFVRAFRYKDGWQDLGRLQPDATSARGIDMNNSGSIVGTSCNAQACRAFLYTDEHGMRDLNNLIDRSLGWELTEATGINDAGQIVGRGLLRGQLTVFRLTPACCSDSDSGSCPSVSGATQPGLNIYDPCGPKTFKITPEPSMRDVVARAHITGVPDDPTPRTTFAWEATVRYWIRQSIPRRLLPLTYRGSRVGGRMPEAVDLFIDPDTRVPVRRGGELKLKASADVPPYGTLSHERTDLKIRGQNPPKPIIEARLEEDAIRAGYPGLAIWLKKIACQESRQRQFAVSDRPRTYQYKDEPYMNEQGDGGMGIMQITPGNEPVSDSQLYNWLWDWKENVDEGVRHFIQGKLPVARGFPSKIRNYRSGMERPLLLQQLLERTNEFRRRQTPPQPRLDEILVPDFSPEQVIRDAIRGNNGYAGRDRLRDDRNSRPFRLHQYRLRIREVDGLGQILVVTGERMVGMRRIADAQWDEVPAADRPHCTGCGDPAYVDHIDAIALPCRD